MFVFAVSQKNKPCLIRQDLLIYLNNNTRQVKSYIRKHNNNNGKYINYIISKESSGNGKAKNKHSTAYGLCQRMLSLYPIEQNDLYLKSIYAQFKGCDNYARQRYGGGEKAYQFWLKNHYW